MFGGGLPRDVEGERRLTHRRPRGEDDEVGFLETGEQVVELWKARRNTAHRAAVFLKTLKTFPRLGKLVFDGGEGAEHRRLCYRKNCRLSLIEDDFNVAVFLKAELTDFCRGINKTAQHEFGLDSLRLVASASGGSCRADQLREVTRAAYLVPNFVLL